MLKLTYIGSYWVGGLDISKHAILEKEKYCAPLCCGKESLGVCDHDF